MIKPILFKTIIFNHQVNKDPFELRKIIALEKCPYNFDLEDLLSASTEVLGETSYGTTYKAILKDGTTLVVKRLKNVVIEKKEFEQQIQIMHKFSQHPNVVPLLAWYYSEDEKLLIYDYIAANSFSELLRGKYLSFLFYFIF